MIFVNANNSVVRYSFCASNNAEVEGRICYIVVTRNLCEAVVDFSMNFKIY